MALNIVEKIDKNVKINSILLSVSDKSGLDIFVSDMININPDIKFYSTGGTYKKLLEINGVNEGENLISVSDYTGQPEMQGGLVKTLDFKIYMGLLSETYNKNHQDDIKRVDAVSFDMVIVNLYPFKETVSKKDITAENARTNIDIGGPCMLRASAKNYLRVASVCDPSDYSSLTEELKKTGGMLSLETRFRLSCKTFTHTAEYDKAISTYFTSQNFDNIDNIYNV